MENYWIFFSVFSLIIIVLAITTREPRSREEAPRPQYTAENALRSTAWATWAVAGFALLSTGVGAGVGIAQWSVLDKTLGEMHVEQRPWASADISLANGVTFNVNGANISLLFVFKNTGKSPAQSVSGNLSVFPNFSIPDFQAALKNTCKPLLGGIPLFPGDRFSQVLSTDIPKAELEAITKAHPGDRFFSPVVMTCVTYRMLGNDESHRTAMVFQIQGRDDKGHICCALPMDGGDIPLSKLALTIAPFYPGVAD